uniref:Uncharacterized protein n=1 Tax=Plectus sambesii TaxID=2011161 RepID=A0A914VKU4_9BILA
MILVLRPSGGAVKVSLGKLPAAGGTLPDVIWHESSPVGGDSTASYRLLATRQPLRGTWIRSCTPATRIMEYAVPAVTVVGTGVVAAVLAPFVFAAAAGAMGFSASGVAAGSWGATWMAWGGGTVPAAVSVLQSVGAAGIATATKVCAGLGGAAAAACFFL